MLAGRGPECARLSDLIEGVRGSRGGSLVLRGEPGVGKSELLRWAAARVPPARRLSAAGVESELELPFATLHQLLRPVLGAIDQLPPVQARALHSALGSGPGTGQDRFLVGVATLTLLCECAGETGLVCLIDDAQWVDSASMGALGFVARRLDADGVALIFGARDGDSDSVAAAQVDALQLDGLAADDAAALLTQAAPALAEPVARRLIEATGGNPLALLELPAQLTMAQRLGEDPLPEPLPVGRDVQRAFAAVTAQLPADTKTLLVLVAAEDTGQLGVIGRAAQVLEVDLGALGPAEEAGLIRVIAGRVEFRHPLVRSAVYQQAPFATRRSAHRALAAVLDDLANLDRRAWHLAASVTGPDAEIATLLEQSAVRARARSGPGPAAAALERAAALSADPQERGRRLVSAAEASWTAGRPAQAIGLLDRAEPLLTDQPVRSGLLGLRGLIDLSGGSPQSAYPLLLRGAADAPDTHSALTWLALAGEAAWLAGDPNGPIELGQRARELAPAETASDQAIADLLVGVAGLGSGNWDVGCGRMRRVLRGTGPDDDPFALFRGGQAALYLGDEASARRLYGRAVGLLRRTGAVGLLATALDRLAFSEALSGRLADARLAASEGLQLARELGQQDAAASAVLALVEACRGQADSCQRNAGQALAQAEARRLGAVAAGACWALGLLDLGMGRPAEALARLGPMVAGHGLSHPTIALWAIPDLVEAAARAGNPHVARAPLAQFSAWTQRTGAPWSIAVAHRGAALLGDGDLDRFSQALEHHDGDHRLLDQARTQLCFGEALRRARRRIDARVQLRSALATFERLGAAPWADRARAELRATGESVAKPGIAVRDRLTPQELQITRLAAGGASNPEIAGQLFVSRKTVEYHLHKVFTKLGIAGRLELVKLDLS
jgi:DNA-binding CsgD family transcriptional regulator/tetratricopeptide (TPR) repeat protein